MNFAVLHLFLETAIDPAASRNRYLEAAVGSAVSRLPFVEASPFGATSKDMGNSRGD